MVTFFTILGILLLINVLLFKYSVAGGPAQKPKKRVAPIETTFNESAYALNKAS